MNYAWEEACVIQGNKEWCKRNLGRVEIHMNRHLIRIRDEKSSVMTSRFEITWKMYTKICVKIKNTRRKTYIQKSSTVMKKYVDDDLRSMTEIGPGESLEHVQSIVIIRQPSIR